jgi:hypothetical protein
MESSDNITTDELKAWIDNMTELYNTKLKINSLKEILAKKNEQINNCNKETQEMNDYINQITSTQHNADRIVINDVVPPNEEKKYSIVKDYLERYRKEKKEKEDQQKLQEIYQRTSEEEQIRRTNEYQQIMNDEQRISEQRISEEEYIEKYIRDKYNQATDTYKDIIEKQHIEEESKIQDYLYYKYLEQNEKDKNTSVDILEKDYQHKMKEYEEFLNTDTTNKELEVNIRNDNTEVDNELLKTDNNLSSIKQIRFSLFNKELNNKIEQTSGNNKVNKMINICKNSLDKMNCLVTSDSDKILNSPNLSNYSGIENKTPRILARIEEEQIPELDLNKEIDLDLEIKSELFEKEKQENIEEKLTNRERIERLSNILNGNKKRKTNFIDNYGYEEYMYYTELEETKKQKIELIENQIKSLNKTDIPIRFKILSSKIPIKNKATIIHKLDDLLSSRFGINPELTKYINWINSLLKIPFGKYIEFDLKKDDEPDKISTFLNSSKEILDDAIYGHIETKEYILEIIAQWIRNPNSQNNMIALNGSAGTGKTCIIKDGLAKVLNRPFIFISLGGISNVSFFNGHSFTYEGSTFGKIAEALMYADCMNPIIYFDELDKVGETPHGEEIINLLIHLTDSSQNECFNDKYFSSIPIDLSQCLFIFSFNNIGKINPILLDRLSIINVNNYNIDEKCTIGLKYLLPKIYQEFKLDDNHITITEDNIKYILTNYIEETGGVRPLKKCLNKIVSRINYLLFMQNYELFNNYHNTKKIVLDNNIIDNLIKNNNLERFKTSYNFMYL